MNEFILDLQSVKCPMNLVLVKKSVHEGSFVNGGKILILDETARRNITKYLQAKDINFEVKPWGILVAR